MEPDRPIAIIQGASRGLGLELTRQLLERGERVVATCRAPERAEPLQELAAQRPSLRVLPLDLEDEATIAEVAERLQGERAHLLMNVAGLLHDGALGPEKKLDMVEPANLKRVFAVNAHGPLLVAKHLSPLLLHGERAVLANLSARVGSIDDNRLGGWYAYRASKAAQNMYTKNLSIELARRSDGIRVIALHPGTVATDLSAPFSKRVPDDKLFSVERAARQLLAIVDGVGPDDNGAFFAWDGSRIAW